MRKILGLCLLFAGGVFGFGAWYTLSRGILIAEASTFLVPFLWYLPLILSLLLGALLWQERSFALAGTVAIFLPSILQAPTVTHSLIVVGSGALVFLGIQRVQSELNERIHLALRRSLLAGAPLFVLGMSLVLSSQYFVQAQTLSWERLVPSFDLAEGAGPVVIQMIKPFYPELGRLQDKTVTVDSFLREVQESSRSEAPAVLPRATQDMLWEEELARTKKELSRLLGREVLGTENMQALLNEVLRKKTIALVSEESTKLPVPVLPLFLAILLFLTLYPLLAFLMPFVSLLAVLFFRSFRAWGWVQVTTLAVERERIAA